MDEMKRHLRQFVKNELFPWQTPPPSTNRRYYPTDVDIRNHMYQASVRQMLSKIDQENLEKKIGVRSILKTHSVLDPAPYLPHLLLLKERMMKQMEIVCRLTLLKIFWLLIKQPGRNVL